MSVPEFRRRVRGPRQAFPAVEVSDDGKTRALYLGSRTVQSEMSLADPTALLLSYTRSMMGCLLFNPAPRRVLQIGLGGGSLTRFIYHRLPGAVSDVVEINPQVVNIARSLFQVPPDDERLTVQLADGVEFVQHCTGEYDLILVDAFDGQDIITAMVEEPFLHDCRQALSEAGMVAINLWSGHPHYRRHVDTLRHAFDGKVLLLPASTHGNLVAMAFRTTPGPLRWEALDKVAAKLETEYRLEFPAFVAALRRDNEHTASKLVL